MVSDLKNPFLQFIPCTNIMVNSSKEDTYNKHQTFLQI